MFALRSTVKIVETEELRNENPTFLVSDPLLLSLSSDDPPPLLSSTLPSLWI